MAGTPPSPISPPSAVAAAVPTKYKGTPGAPVAAAVVAELAITSAPQVGWALLTRETTAEAPGMTTQKGVLPAVAAVAPED